KDGPLSTTAILWDQPTGSREIQQSLAGNRPRLTLILRARISSDLLFSATRLPPLASMKLMPVVDQPDGTGLACTPFSAANAATLLWKGRVHRSRGVPIHNQGIERAECGRHRGAHR